MYREWNTPFGLTEHLSGIVRKDVIRVGAISALRRDPFGEAERERLKLLLPHLRRSISIAQLMDEKTSGERQLRTVVDALAAPVLFVDDSLRLHYANRAAERLLREENLFKLGRSRLSCHSARDQKALLTAIRSGASGQSSLSLTAGDQQIVMATLLPLNQGLRREASQPTLATVALFINAPSERFEFAGEAIARQFRLTGAELQLLLALLEGDTVRKAAERFGVARSTVKTHLQRLFAKTGVTRQSDLIRKMNGLARGVVGRDANPTLIHQ
jgi:DNA-binding CsgD family transcriptional regulator